MSHDLPQNPSFAGSGGAAAKERPADRRREHVVEIKMQLSEEADAVRSGVDWNLRFGPAWK